MRAFGVYWGRGLCCSEVLLVTGVASSELRIARSGYRDVGVLSGVDVALRFAHSVCVVASELQGTIQGRV